MILRNNIGKENITNTEFWMCVCVCARVHAQSVLTITKKKNLDWILFFSCSVSLCLFCSILDKWDLSVIASISPLAISYKYLRVRVCVWMFRKTKKSRLDNNPHFFSLGFLSHFLIDARKHTSPNRQNFNHKTKQNKTKIFLSLNEMRSRKSKPIEKKADTSDSNRSQTE